MNPNERAENIINECENKLYDSVENTYSREFLATQFALMFVNNIIDELSNVYCSGETDIDDNIKYWNRVKQEIKHFW